MLQVFINREGSVSKVEVVSGPPLLTRAAQDAVKQWGREAINLFGLPKMEVGSVIVPELPAALQSTGITPEEPKIKAGSGVRMWPICVPLATPIALRAACEKCTCWEARSTLWPAGPRARGLFP